MALFKHSHLMSRDRDAPPPVYYVKYEDAKLIRDAKRKHGEEVWLDFVDRDEIINVANFETLEEALAFTRKIQGTKHYAAVFERQNLEWIEDLKYWEWEWECIHD